MSSNSYLIFIPIIILFSLNITSCSKTTFQQSVEYEEKNGGIDIAGIVYQEQGTYLLVSPDYKNSTVKITKLTLPNTTKLNVVESFAWLASNDTTINFNHGMIKDISSEQSSIKVPKAIVETLSAVGKAALEAAASASMKAASGAKVAKGNNDKPIPPIYFYKVDGNQVIQLYPVGKGNSSKGDDQ